MIQGHVKERTSTNGVSKPQLKSVRSLFGQDVKEIHKIDSIQKLNV